MVRHLMICLALVAVAATPAFAISVDGDISDWTGLLQQDAIGDQAPNGIDISRFGWTVAYDSEAEEDFFYAVMELDNFDIAPLRRFFPAAFINADASTATTLGANDANDNPSTFEAIGKGILTGTDISVEWGKDKEEGTGTHPDKSYNFWGAGDLIDNVVANGVAGGAHAYVGRVMEWSAPVSSIMTAMGALPDGVTSPASQWSVIIGGQAEGVGGAPPSYGYDYGEVVPEPGTLLLTILGLLGVSAYAWRKR